MKLFLSIVIPAIAAACAFLFAAFRPHERPPVKLVSPAPQEIIPQSDLHAARIAALRHVIATRSSSGGVESFVLKDVECVVDLKRNYPAITPYSENQIRWEGGAPIDTVRGGRVTILGIDLSEVSDDTAKVAITAQSGNVGIVGYVLNLKKESGAWQVVSTKIQALA